MRANTASQAAAALCARVVSQTAKGGCGLASCVLRRGGLTGGCPSVFWLVLLDTPPCRPARAWDGGKGIGDEARRWAGGRVGDRGWGKRRGLGWGRAQVCGARRADLRRRASASAPRLGWGRGARGRGGTEGIVHISRLLVFAFSAALLVFAFSGTGAEEFPDVSVHPLSFLT